MTETKTRHAVLGIRASAERQASHRVTNVRDDKVRSGRFWRNFEQRRCLAPASS
jgi:putative SOS response-associated peptidase YedK